MLMAEMSRSCHEKDARIGFSAAFMLIGRHFPRASVGDDGLICLRVFFSGPNGYERFLLTRFNR